jgi:geranylgeranyl pyrophosphate synthase
VTNRGVPARSAILAYARDFALQRVRQARHREMIALAFSDDAGEPERPDSALRYAHAALAPLIYSAATGDPEFRVDLAALTLTLWKAFDLLDDVADDDLKIRWIAYKPSEITVLAGCLMFATASALVASLHPSPTVIARLHERIARAGFEIADGQIADIAQTGGVVTVTSALEAAAGKTGAAYALFAGTGAILGGASSASAGCYETLGFEYGMAMQFLNDLEDLLASARSSDLANGTRSLPLVRHLETLCAASRARFLESLDAARTDQTAAAAVRSTLVASPALRRAVLDALIHIERARTALGRSGATEPAATLLAALLDDLRPFGTPERRRADNTR